MMLSPVPAEQLDTMFNVLDRALAPWPGAQSAFQRIADTRILNPGFTHDLYMGHNKAVDLARQLGMSTCDEAPCQSFSWDGHAVRIQTETAVLLHEIAHWQIAPAHRHVLPDFGLGAGPDTGRTADANAACCVDNATKEEEESLASLLGILWEVELGGPAVLAFCEQNWLELYDRPGTARHFASVFETLLGRGLIKPDSRPNPDGCLNAAV